MLTCFCTSSVKLPTTKLGTRAVDVIAGTVAAVEKPVEAVFACNQTVQGSILLTFSQNSDWRMVFGHTAAVVADGELADAKVLLLG